VPKDGARSGRGASAWDRSSRLAALSRQRGSPIRSPRAFPTSTARGSVAISTSAAGSVWANAHASTSERLSNTVPRRRRRALVRSPFPVRLDPVGQATSPGASSPGIDDRRTRSRSPGRRTTSRRKAEVRRRFVIAAGIAPAGRRKASRSGSSLTPSSVRRTSTSSYPSSGTEGVGKPVRPLGAPRRGSATSTTTDGRRIVNIVSKPCPTGSPGLRARCG